MDDQFASIAQIKNTLIDLAIRFGPKVLAALLILAVGFFVGRWIGRARRRAWAVAQRLGKGGHQRLPPWLQHCQSH